MSGELPFIDIDGIEVCNGYRTMSYLRLLGGPKWIVPEVYPCSILAREIGGVGPFTSPSADPAPWYDATVPESADFFGFMPSGNQGIDFQTLDVVRSATQRFGGIGGGVIGVEQVAVRAMTVTGLLIAVSCQGLEYGRHWIYSRLGSDCAGCSLRTIRVRESCPPSNGSNDTRGERIMYDSALIAGIARNDNPGQPCCDYDGITFTLASESPYLYSRAGSPSSTGEIQSSGKIMVLPPTILDTMIRANTGPPPSASWTGVIVTGNGNTLTIVSNQLTNNSTTLQGAAYWNAATFGPDCAVTVVVPTRVANGQFSLWARITTPGAGTGQGVYCRITFGGSTGTDTVLLGRMRSLATQSPMIDNLISNQTFASGDTFALVCRGHLIECWRLPSGGQWSRLIAVVDPNVAVVGNVGIAIESFTGIGQHLGAFGAGTLTNGSCYPLDVITVAMPAVGIGIESPIITLTQGALTELDSSGTGLLVTNINASTGIRFQLKQMASCSETDNFAVDDEATNWADPTSGYSISGGTLNPTVTGSGGSGRQFQRAVNGVLLKYAGGRVEATVALAGTITNGAWGVSFQAAAVGSNGQFAATLVQNTAGGGTNKFQLSNDPNGSPVLDSVSFTPLANTTYRIILELLPVNDGTGNYAVRGYLVDANNVMLTRPLLYTAATQSGIAIGGVFNPAITSIPASTSEKWDSFFCIDYTDSDAYLDATIPPGKLVIDGSRRVTAFTPTGSADSVEGSGYLSTPIDTPLGWPDVCGGTGPGCLQIFAGEAPYPGTTATVALQQRVR